MTGQTELKTGGGDARVEEPPRADERRRDVGEDFFRAPFARPAAGALRNVLVSLAIGAIILWLVWFLDRSGGASSNWSITLSAVAAGPAPRLGKEAPDFRVQSPDGQQFQLSDLRGRPVWVTFWASWCPPCRAEQPDIEAVFEANGDAGLVILAMNVGEDTQTVRDYIARTRITYTVGLDKGTSIAAAYRIVGLPTHFFIDADGVVRSWRIGSMSKGTMQREVEKILPSTR